MLIKCRECKTVYDDNEKYCPFCFTRTKEIVRYRTNVDSRLEGSVMKKRAATKFNYQKRATTKYKPKKTSPVVVIIPILFMLLFFYVFMHIIFNMIFFF